MGEIRLDPKLKRRIEGRERGKKGESREGGREGRKREWKKIGVVTILGLTPPLSRNGESPCEGVVPSRYLLDLPRLFRQTQFPEEGVEALNMLDLLGELHREEEYQLIPLYTKKAKEHQLKLLSQCSQFPRVREKVAQWLEGGIEIADEKNTSELFRIFNQLLESKEYFRLIIDVTHGFRHLPLLFIIRLMMENFTNQERIISILFGMEQKRGGPGTPGEYLIVDLKEYLDLANLAILLGTFKSNYTIDSSIKISRKFGKLQGALQRFSEDTLSLNIQSLLKYSLPFLRRQLEKIEEDPTFPAIQELRDQLLDHLTQFPSIGEPRYSIYYKLGRLMLEKNYLLNSITLLNESGRAFLFSYLRAVGRKNPEVGRIVEYLHNLARDEYQLGDWMGKLYRFPFLPRGFPDITPEEYRLLRKSLAPVLTTLPRCPFGGSRGSYYLLNCISHGRNSLAHANTRIRFAEVKRNILFLFNQFHQLIEKLHQLQRETSPL